MKAVLVEKLGSIEGLGYKNHQLPAPAEDQVLIKVAYAGVNFPDILITKGLYQFQPELPFSPGGEVAGTVLEVGSSITHLKTGDRVVSGTGWGGFAEEVLGFGFNTHKLPDDISFEDGAATLMTYGTVIHGLKDRAKLESREKLVVLGASGGVGTAAVQVGKLLGAHVIACTSTDDKIEYCKSLGADQCVNYTAGDLKSNIKELTQNGADVIFDPVGGPHTESAFRAIARGGRHLVVGFASGQVPSIPLNLPLLKSASLVGVFWGGFFRNEPLANASNIQLLFNWIRNKKLLIHVDNIFPLDSAIQALKVLESRGVKGKILLKVIS